MTSPPTPALIVVTDRAETRIYRVERPDGAWRRIVHDDPVHVMHPIDREAHDADRNETWPDDTAAFERIAGALAADGDIVIIGHGKGQSHEASHLSAYLARRHPSIHARIARELTADLAHLTTGELLDLGRHALAAG